MAEEESQRTADEQKAIDEAFAKSMISPRFRERTFQTFQIELGNEKAYRIAHQFEMTPEGKGLMFYGSVGIGKTHLAAAIAQKYLGKESILYISVPDFLEELRETKADKTKSHRMSLAKSVKLLILDDIGAEKPSEWVRESLFMLINHRYEHKLTTIFTSNFHLSELERRIGERVCSRIVEMCRCVKIEGEDWRFKKAIGYK